MPQNLQKAQYSGTTFVFLALLLGLGLLNASKITIPSQPLEHAHLQDPLLIVATMDLVADWTGELGETLIDVTTIVTGLEDPHTYEPTASEVQAIEECDLFIRFGIPGLEPWMTAFIAAHPEVTTKMLTLVNFSDHEYMEIDPLLGEYNGHIWMNPQNVKAISAKIYSRLVELDPAREATYTMNFLNYQSDLDALLSRINTARTVYNGVKVVVHHPAFYYLFQLLGITRLGIIEEHHGTEPSADHIAEIITTMIAEDCQLLVNQPQLEEDDVIAIARATGALIADLTPLLGVYNLTTYIEMIDYNLYALAHPVPPPPVEFDSALLNSYLIIASIGTLIIVIVVMLLIVYRRRP
jgi:ABC-type Zn uptake system ZnuABC Zn-binding protein ZnuA